MVFLLLQIVPGRVVMGVVVMKVVVLLLLLVLVVARRFRLTHYCFWHTALHLYCRRRRRSRGRVVAFSQAIAVGELI
uniref:Putative secreted peptide n=1 Tax=Anopheles braziliensis TaxID=58242 RepID=A0A2M3ZP25_9DIPT